MQTNDFGSFDHLFHMRSEQRPRLQVSTWLDWDSGFFLFPWWNQTASLHFGGSAFLLLLLRGASALRAFRFSLPRTLRPAGRGGRMRGAEPPPPLFLDMQAGT